MNLIKKGLIVFIIFSFTIVIKAQVNFGIIGGLNLANISNGIGTKNYSTFHFGGIMNMEINEYFSIQPELLFTGKGYRSSFISMTGLDIISISNPFYLEIPVLLKISTKGLNGINIFGAIGPYFGIGVAGQYQTTIDGHTFTEKFDWWDDEVPYKRLDIGFTLNAGIEIHNLILNIYYDLGINNIISSNSNNSINNRVLGFSLGYIFK